MNNSSNKQTVNTDFKLQHPQDLVSRLFILEYIRELGVDVIRQKLDDVQHVKWVYIFEDQDGSKQYDLNWEYLVFVISLPELSKIMEKYLDEIEVIESKRKERHTKLLETKLEHEMQADISLYDLAQSDMRNQKNKLD